LGWKPSVEFCDRTKGVSIPTCARRSTAFVGAYTPKLVLGLQRDVGLCKTVWQGRQAAAWLYDLNALLLLWKDQRFPLTQVYSQVLQNVQTRVHLAFAQRAPAFFRRVRCGEGVGYLAVEHIGQNLENFLLNQAESSDGVLCGGIFSRLGNKKVWILASK
jgi:hypothetical protein